jgi:ribonuclease P protein component
VKKHTLGKEERLKSRKLIDLLFKSGKGFSVFPFRVYYLRPGYLPARPRPARRANPEIQVPDSSGDTTNSSVTLANAAGASMPRHTSLLQFGVGVSTKNFKHAVDRNRVKRITREAYRLQKEALQQAVQLKQEPFVIFLIYTGKELPEYQLASEKVAIILNRLQKIVHEIPAAHT